jgi:glycosyltransferase involved in cell wall biosynthesis
MTERRVVQIFFVVANRGGERVAAQLERGFRARGLRPSSVGFYRSAAPNADTEHFTVLASRRPRPHDVVLVWWKLYRLLRRERPAAVILHTQVAALLGASAALVARVPSRIVIHHINVGVSGRAFRPIEAAVGSSGLYTDIVFVGNAIRDDIGRFPKRYRRRTSVIPNAVEVPPSVDRLAVRARHGIPADAFVVLAVGAMTDQKNHEVLVRALAEVPAATLVIAGDGPLRPMLEQLATDTGARVLVLGHIPSEDVLALYGAADVYAMPSRAEGRSLALLDAVSSGLPVVLSDIGQNVEVMGDAARYCPTEDVACWARCLGALAADPHELAALRASCAAHDIGTVDAVVDAYVACIARAG